MATRTKPLISAALVSAAAVAVATPALAPNAALPTPPALTRAAVALTTISDVLAIPASEWSDLLFYNTQWGGSLSDTTYGPEFAKPSDFGVQTSYVNPWATYCGNGCYRQGVSAVAYLFFDALINGDNVGWDALNPGEGWKIGLVNYIFEPNATFIIGGGSSPGVQSVSEGWSAATWYLLQGTLGQAVPALQVPIASLFWGPLNLSVAYNIGLTAIANVAANTIPAVGPFIGNSILAYLGDLPLPGSNPSDPTYYQYGLSGPLNYWINILNGSEQWPTAPAAPAEPAAAVKAAVSPAAVTAAEAVSSDAPAVTGSEAAADDTATDSTPAAEDSEATPAVDASESTPVAEAPEVVETVKVAEVTSAPAPAKVAPKRPFKDAVEKATKQITSAIDNAKTKAAARSAATKDRLAKAAAGSDK